MQPTAYPLRPEIGASNREIDIYAKRLEFALWQCNQDKQNLIRWEDDGSEDD